jgi:hypothetical protein
MNIPTALVVGDTWQWDADYGDYPRPTWSATAYFENAAESFSVASTANGTAQRFSALATATDDFKAGRYHVSVRVTDGVSVKVAETGWCDVAPDPASGAKVDHRSWARRTLDAIEAFLEGNATTAQQSISIAGRSISRWSVAELMQWRDKLRAEVRAEEQGSAAGLGRDIRVRLIRG